MGYRLEALPQLSEAAIRNEVRSGAYRLAKQYAEAELPTPKLIVIAVLEAASRFLAELVLEFAQLKELKGLSSVWFWYNYVKGTSYVGEEKVRLLQPNDVLIPFEPRWIEGRPVLVIDVVAETGDTLAAVGARLRSYGPKTLSAWVLVKKGNPVVSDEYDEFSCSCEVSSDHFLVGYGLDYKGDFRNLSGISRLVLMEEKG